MKKKKTELKNKLSTLFAKQGRVFLWFKYALYLTSSKPEHQNLNMVSANLHMVCFPFALLHNVPYRTQNNNARRILFISHQISKNKILFQVSLVHVVDEQKIPFQ